MSSLLGSLPAPRLQAAAAAPAPAPQAVVTTVVRGRATTAPGYGARKGFVPRKPSDFGDGGAYPECHVAQHPLDMGRGGQGGAGGASAGSIVPVSVDAEGKVDYGAIVRQGANASKTVATTHNALVPKLHTLQAEVRRPPALLHHGCAPAVLAARARGRPCARQTWKPFLALRAAARARPARLPLPVAGPAATSG